MSPHRTMEVAERLYTQGFISYPRTETTQYADSFDLRDVVRQRARADLSAACLDACKSLEAQPSLKARCS